MRKLIVDGYNIIHAHSILKKILLKDGLEAAREELIKQLAIYAHTSGQDISVVFDSAISSVAQKETLGEVTVYYPSKKSSADNFIERMVYLAAQDNLAQEMVIATSDHLHADMVRGMGGQVMSAMLLEIELNEANGQLEGTLATQNQRHAFSNRLEYSLSDKSKRELEKFKKEYQGKL